MCTKNDMQLSLNGDTFKALKEDFDSILGRTIGNMEMKRADEATITIKLGITLQKVNNGTLEESKEVTKPTFKHDISSVMQVKDKKSGSIAGDYELIWDKDEEKYIMRKIGTEQMSVFDEEIAVEVNDAECEENADSCYYLEAPAESYRDETDSGDTEDRNDELLSRMKWIEMFIGRNFEVVERNGIYVVRTDTNEVVLTSEDSMFHVDAEILKKHKNHTIKCIGFYSEATETEGESLQSVKFRCEDCFETICEFTTYSDTEDEACVEEEPDFEEDDCLKYDDPDVE